MHLAGQGNSGVAARVRDRDGGYAMAALLVGLSVMSVLMGTMLPVWSQLVRREKEEELIFRGQQYARAIGLFQRKFANTAPPTVDLLVEQRFLRKKYKDPVTNGDFQLIYANQAQQGVSAPTGALRPGQVATAAFGTPGGAPTGAGTSMQGADATAPPGAGGIIGVASKSKSTSIKVYNGRTKYNEWAFVYLQMAQRPGGAPTSAPGQGGRPGFPARPGQPGQPGQLGQPGQPGPPRQQGQPGQPGQGQPRSPFGVPGGGRPPES